MYEKIDNWNLGKAKFLKSIIQQRIRSIVSVLLYMYSNI